MSKPSKTTIAAIIVGLIVGMVITCIPRQGRTIDFSNNCNIPSSYPTSSTDPDPCKGLLQDTGYPFKVYTESPGDVIGTIYKHEVNNFIAYVILDILIGFGLGYLITKLVIDNYKKKRVKK